jgi:hypothetical protein
VLVNSFSELRSKPSFELGVDIKENTVSPGTAHEFRENTKVSAVM